MQPTGKVVLTCCKEGFAKQVCVLIRENTERSSVKVALHKHLSSVLGASLGLDSVYVRIVQMCCR